MTLEEMYDLFPDSYKNYFDYVCMYLEYYGEGNEELKDSCREGIEHNGEVERINILTGKELIEPGFYVALCFGHDGRELLVRYNSLEEAINNNKCLLENTFVNDIVVIDTVNKKVIKMKIDDKVFDINEYI